MEREEKVFLRNEQKVLEMAPFYTFVSSFANSGAIFNCLYSLDVGDKNMYSCNVLYLIAYLCRIWYIALLLTTKAFPFVNEKVSFTKKKSSLISDN